MKSIKAVAVNDRLILKKREESEQMVGAIYIPDVQGQTSNVYEVIDVGPGNYNPFHNIREPMSFKVGDIITVPKGLVYEIRIDNEVFYVTREKEIHARIQIEDGE